MYKTNGILLDLWARIRDEKYSEYFDFAEWISRELNF